MLIIIFLPFAVGNTHASGGQYDRLLETADSLVSAREFQSAVEYGLKAMKVSTAAAVDDSVLAHVNYKLGLYYRYNLQFAEAEIYLKKAIDIGTKIFGPEHPLIARFMHDLARVYNKAGYHKKSENLHREVIALRKKILEPNHPELGLSYAYLALVCRNQSKLFEAIRNYENAIEIMESAIEKDDPLVAKCLIDYGVALDRQGRYDEAWQAYSRSLEIYTEAFGPDNIYASSCYANLGGICMNQGNYTAAEEFIKRALAIKVGKHGPSHTNVANNMSNLGELYCYLNNFTKAEEIFSRVLEIYIDSLGRMHPAVANTMSSLGLVYQKMGNYDRARRFLTESIHLTDSLLGDHPNKIRNLLDLSEVLKHLGDLHAADTLLEKALEICENVDIADNPTTADILNQLAINKIEQGLINEAHQYMDRAFAIRNYIYGRENPAMARSYETFSAYWRKIGNYEKAFENARTACDIMMTSFNDNAACMSENDALVFSNLYKKSVDRLLTCYFDIASPDMSTSRHLADLVLCGKGQVSDRIFERCRTLAREDDPELIEINSRLDACKFRLSKLYVESYAGYAEPRPAQLDSLQNCADSLENELLRRSDIYRQQKDFLNINTDRVAAHIPENAVLVEYVNYDYTKPDSGEEIPRCLAIVFSAKSQPAIIDLGDSAPIDSAIDAYREHMFRVSSKTLKITSADIGEYRQLCGRLNELIWIPLSRYVSGSEMVMIAPDGKLNNLSFAGLIGPDNKYLIEKYAIHYLSAGRDILRNLDPVEAGEGLFALGDPDYDAPASARIDSSPQTDPDDAASPIYGHINVRSGSEHMDKINLSPLPASRDEINMISDAWTASTDEPAYVFTDFGATEDCFKSRAPGCRIIHLATHAFFWRDGCGIDQTRVAVSTYNKWAGENPLLQSGLFLAGANLHGLGADSVGIDDGFLTAYEVSAMDLDGTEMVILSACETGLGHIQQGEGVYGLRRAFQMAGVKTVVSTLWPVVDRMASDFFGRLYQRNGIPIPQAIRQVQLEKINGLRSRNKPDHPVHWAPFVVFGDWR